MDIQRSPEVAKKKKLKRIIFGVAALLVGVLVTVGLAQLKPAAPTVEAATTWRDSAKRGPMLRQVRGPGTLVPEDIRWLTAATEADGRAHRHAAERQHHQGRHGHPGAARRARAAGTARRRTAIAAGPRPTWRA